MQRQKGEIEKKEELPIKKSQPPHQERGSFYIKIKGGKRVDGHFRIFAREVRGKSRSFLFAFSPTGTSVPNAKREKECLLCCCPPAEERQLY